MAIPHNADHAISDSELRNRNVESRGGKLQELLPGCRRGMTQLGTRKFDGSAAGSNSLIDGGGGIARDHLDLLELHVELVGDDLAQSGFHARAEIHFARKHRDHAVAPDGDPGIERSRLQVSGEIRPGAELRHSARNGAEKIEAYD